MAVVSLMGFVLSRSKTFVCSFGCRCVTSACKESLRPTSSVRNHVAPSACFVLDELHRRCDRLCSGQTHVQAVVFKDDLRSLHFVHLGSLPHRGLGLLHPAPREQPARRLWDPPETRVQVQAGPQRLNQKGERRETCPECNPPPEGDVEQAGQGGRQQQRPPVPQEVSEQRQHHEAEGKSQTHAERGEEDPDTAGQDLIA